jgi:hypothetical protein
VTGGLPALGDAGERARSPRWVWLSLRWAISGCGAGQAHFLEAASTIGTCFAVAGLPPIADSAVGIQPVRV